MVCISKEGASLAPCGYYFLKALPPRTIAGFLNNFTKDLDPKKAGDWIDWNVVFTSHRKKTVLKTLIIFETLHKTTLNIYSKIVEYNIYHSNRKLSECSYSHSNTVIKEHRNHGKILKQFK